MVILHIITGVIHKQKLNIINWTNKKYTDKISNYEL